MNDRGRTRTRENRWMLDQRSRGNKTTVSERGEEPGQLDAQKRMPQREVNG